VRRIARRIQRRTRHGVSARRFFLLACGVAAASAAAASFANGAVPIAPSQIAAILGAQLGIPPAWSFEPRQEAVLLAIRLPRVLLGALTGAVLAVAGAAVQGLLRNPLADPALLGISAGAALAAAATIVCAPALPVAIAGWAAWTLLPVTAFTGAVAATAIVHRLANRNGHTSVATVLLAGIAINAIAGAGTGLLAHLATDAQLRDITFWTLGSLAGATWPSLAVAAPMLAAALLLARPLVPALDLLLLGESEARHLGVDVEAVKRRIVLLVGLGVGAAVSITGIIGFVGLVVPHVVRLIAGPAHRTVLPASALLGAALLLAADLASRTAVAPAELPIGVLTGLIGGPFFLWLLTRNRAAAWV